MFKHFYFKAQYYVEVKETTHSTGLFQIEKVHQLNYFNYLKKINNTYILKHIRYHKRHLNRYFYHLENKLMLFNDQKISSVVFLTTWLFSCDFLKYLFIFFLIF